MRFDCSTCTDPSLWAYVFPSDLTDTVYLCPTFWTVPAIGKDSQAGTLPGAVSEFTSVAGTVELAATNPAQAVQNTDNHHYFAESFAVAPPTPTSTPALTPTPTATATPVATATPAGFVPPDADTAKCEQAVAKQLAKLAACAAKCRADEVTALMKGKSFDVAACERGAGKPPSCRAAFDAASAKLLAKTPPICPPCLDATAQSDAADRVLSSVEGRSPGLYCAGATPLP